MSSRYTITKSSRKVLSTSFINLMKVAGALVKPKGITSHSYNPYFVLSSLPCILLYNSDLTVSTVQIQLGEINNFL